MSLMLRIMARNLSCTLAIVAWVSAARADVANLTAAKDNMILSESDDLSDGAGDYFFAGRNNAGNSRRGLIQFDVSAIPAGSTITSVQLTLYMSRSKQGTDPVAIHRVLTDWGEGASDADAEEGAGASAEDGDATWRYTFYDTADPPSAPQWTTLGGDYDATASASIPVGNDGQFYTWGSTAAMVADVQAWVDNTAGNYGWILIGDETTNRTAARFNSRTNPTTSTRPVLAVTFTPPAAVGACCLGDGSCALTGMADCDSNGGTYEGDGSSCTPNPCPQPTGACCLGDGTCVITTAVDCSTQGIYQGDGASCTPNPCTPITGACCLDSGACTELTPSDCSSNGGTYQGDFSVCTTGLCPVILEPFVDALAIPPIATPAVGTIGMAATYDMEMVQVKQKLHRDLPPTTVWAYNGVFPGPTIVARRDEPVTVNWINDLENSNGTLRTDHYLDVDLCPHGAANLPKTVVHLHGGHVPADVDGYPESTFLPGNMVTYTYPNNQQASLIWYHDHALGITRLNVYMGLAGAYIIRDAVEDALNLPSGEFEVPLIIQDRTFNPDGSLHYPSGWQDHFFGDTMLVNGTVWPYMNVKQGKYRFRTLNGCNSRTLTLSLSTGQTFQDIGAEGGLLDAPVTLSELTLGPAERADLIIDFSTNAPGSEVILTNSAPAPFPGSPGVGVIPDVMKFVVVGTTGFTDAIPNSLTTLERLDPADSVADRQFVLRKSAGSCTTTEWLINGLHWDDITEFPRLGTTETWTFVNNSGVSHPMHMHLVFFEVLYSQDFQIVGPDITTTGPRVPPPPEQAGWKDTVMVPPQKLVKVIARFEDYPGLYPYHCHILEHEDNEMMRQFRTVVFGDWDVDGDVDLVDFATFVDCISGPDNSPNPTAPVTVPECLEAFDADFDSDVDLEDFATFGLNFGG